MYVHTYIHTFIYTNIPWIHKSVTRQKDVEQVMYLYKNIHNFSGHKTVLQVILTGHFDTLKIHLQSKTSVYLGTF